MLFQKVVFSVCIWNSAYAKAGDARDMGWSLGLEDPLEKEMTTQSYILAWKIPWTEEPGGLHSGGSQRVKHNWVCACACVCTCSHTHTHTHISWKSSRLELRKEKKKTFKYINEWIKLSTALSHLHGNQTSDGNIWKQKEIFMSNTIREKKKKSSNHLPSNGRMNWFGSFVSLDMRPTHTCTQANILHMETERSVPLSSYDLRSHKAAPWHM